MLNLNLNRRATEALEKSARAEKRLAEAEETIARHIGEFLRDEFLRKSEPQRPSRNVAPPKNLSPRK